MKLPALTACLAIASSALAFASDEGSYALVTSTLTLTDYTVPAPTVLSNGNKQYAATETTFKVTNAAILAECQRQGILTTGYLTGWKIYAIFDNDDLAGFVINNGVSTVSISDVIDVRRTSVTGFTTKGKWQKNTEGVTISGATSYTDGFLLDVTINGVIYTSTCAPRITDKVVTFGVLADPVWKPSAFKITVTGLSSEEDGDGRVMQGALSMAAAKANWDLGLSLLGFPGFVE